MVILMVLGFMLAWTPYAVVAFWIFTNKGADFTATLMAVPAFFSKSSSLYNPIIYVLMNKQVRCPRAPRLPWAPVSPRAPQSPPAASQPGEQQSSGLLTVLSPTAHPHHPRVLTRSFYLPSSVIA